MARRFIPQLDTSERLGAVLAVLAIVTLAAHVFRSGADMSQTETTLFGILQFVFSIAFAWIVSRASSKREFETSQKKFAISAYRRIREVEQSVDRLLARIRGRQQECTGVAAQELNVVQEIARGIQATIVSSTSDWADIIGDEIATVEKVERLRREQSLDTAALYRVVSDGDGGRSEEVQQRLDDSVRVLNELIAGLPASLQVTEKAGGIAEADGVKTIIALISEISGQGSLVLEGFWESGYGLDEDIRNCDLSQAFTVVIERCGVEYGPLNLKNMQGETVGRIMNMADVTYDVFAKSVWTVLGMTEFQVKLEIAEGLNESNGRAYFKVRYTPGKNEPENH